MPARGQSRGSRLRRVHSRMVQVHHLRRAAKHDAEELRKAQEVCKLDMACKKGLIDWDSVVKVIKSNWPGMAKTARQLRDELRNYNGSPTKAKLREQTSARNR